MTNEHPEVIRLAQFSPEVKKHEQVVSECSAIRARLAALEVENDFDTLPDFFSFDMDGDLPPIHTGRRRAV